MSSVLAMLAARYEIAAVTPLSLAFGLVGLLAALVLVRIVMGFADGAFTPPRAAPAD